MALADPPTEPLAPASPQPSSDRAPDWVAAGTPEPLRSQLTDLLGAAQVLSRASDLVRYASDASPYRMIPKAVVRPRDERDVAALMGFSRREGIPLVFRSGGTSLNGQSQSDGILVDVRHHWRGLEVLDDGAAARVRPGTILGHANIALAPHGTRLGPDPASTDIATVGGVVANNSGGMRCGTTADSYSTVRSLRFVLPSGTAIDTAAPGAAERFAAAEPELHAGLAEIRDRIRGDADMRERIRRKFEIKNTTGYRLCAFLDADDPLEIFRRLLVGSEGTLAFVSEATFETVAVPARTSLAWVHFPGIAEATAPVPELVALGATAVEMMVAPALMVAAHSIPGTPEYWKELAPESAALLIELAGDDADELARAEAAADELLEGFEVSRAFTWARELETIELFWRVREGLHGLVGKLRPPGTALIVEDVCVPPARIAECANDIRELLGEHGFLTGVAGHTSAGNLHFMLTPDFSKPEDVERYEAFIAKLVDLVLDRYEGSLKAEHGTGVNMAPFVEREWGAEATELMWRVKQLADPDGLLGPGVVLNRDPDCHLANLKTTPEIEEVATTCVECGFCEPVCPSRDLTTTPRQRIVLRREMARQPPGSPVLGALLDEYEYDGLETCAADGTCALACPLGIDTGKLVKGLRAAQHDERAELAAGRVARRWAGVERASRGGLRFGEAVSGTLGDGPLRGLSKAARAAIGAELVPEWVPPMPPPAAPELPRTSRAGAAAVYLPACINRIFGRAHPAGASDANGNGQRPMPSLPAALVEVSARARAPVWIPDDVAGRCCGTPWSSKGYADAHAWMANFTVESLWRWSEDGELPVVVDASSCTLGLLEAGPALSEQNAERLAAIEIVDSIAWARDRLLPNLRISSRLPSAAIHPTCASRHLGLDGALAELAGALAEEVVVPATATCCGFAGDRGFLHPELPAAALAEEAAQVRALDAEAHLCANRTCEVGLERETGEAYGSFVYLLEELSRPD